MKTDELREKYLTYFESQGCVRRPSDVLVPRWDPSVLFTPAGMNQFKDHFLGKCKLEFTRATTCQKCLRTGDIDNVGRTPYHHTFFEMLGNFSFGDYFKVEAIRWAWEFLTHKKWLAIDPNRLSVTVYLDDDEAFNIWEQQIKLPASRIRRLGEHDNFWPAGAPTDGPDGVCGPCSEIFYQLDGGGEVEIWNLVFTQFDRHGAPPNNLRPLPSKNIDTGMGLERAASVLQNVPTNFHTDRLRPIVDAAAQACGVKYELESENGRRLRRIADHVRACALAVHENVYPGPNKEKYVIRRLLRRAVLDGRQMKVRQAFLHQLVPVVAEMMRGPYPELMETTDRVANVIREEENNFFGKIDIGLERIERVFTAMKSAGRETVSGEEAAEMYTTHGFPPELFETMAAEHNFGFDWAGFKREMEAHGEISGPTSKMELFASGPLDALKRTIHATKFLGYETTSAEATVVGVIARGELCDLVDEVGHDEPIAVVLDQTPFYGEAGGQVGDTGEFVAPGFRFEVTATLREGGLIVHRGHLRSGKIAPGNKLTAKVDAARRQAIRRAHSATHVLHYALQKHVGSHAQQQGSKVDADWLRFDFSNPGHLGPELVAKIETEVNERVMQGAPVAWRVMPLADARQTGAMMLFGEKYPDEVRVVSMGEFSKELCGGTHLDNTGQIGAFKILAEESVSAGVRRITALTGLGTLAHMHKAEAALAEAATQLRVPVAEVAHRVASLAKEVRDLKKQLAAAGPKASGLSAETLLQGATEIGSVRVIVTEAAGADAGQMRQWIDQLHQLNKKSAPLAILLGSRSDDKVTLVASISHDLEARGLNAGQWITSAADVVGGKGGGKPAMAQAGGKHPEKLPAALEAARARIAELLAIAK